MQCSIKNQFLITVAQKLSNTISINKGLNRAQFRQHFRNNSVAAVIPGQAQVMLKTEGYLKAFFNDKGMDLRRRRLLFKTAYDHRSLRF